MMSAFTSVSDLLFSDPKTTLISLLIGYVVYKLAKFYHQVYTLPPGPLPLPFVGNILQFRGTKEHWSIEISKVARKYGPVFTLWFGRDPMVIISDIDVGREAFRKNDFAGRPYNIFTELLTSGNYTDILVADYGREWEALRRVAHSAVQKYAVTERLIYLANDCVDHTIETIIEREGFDKPFAPFDYFYNLFLNVFAASAFGKRYEFDDPEWKAIKYIQKDFFKEMDQKLLLVDFFPILKVFYSKTINRFKKLFNDTMGLLTDKYISHYKDYDEGVVRDFCDALITAKNEALKEGKESAPYLTDGNLGLVIGDLFLAGTDNSQTTLSWMLLFMTYYPEVNKRLRLEIESEIGDRMPTHEDRNRCHYVMAFISEVMRLKVVAPGGIPHKAMVSSKIGEYTIPEGMQVLLFIGDIHRQEKNFDNPEEFRPERFLEDNGQYVSTRPKGFIPFGVGRRGCLGEKLAIADLFLVFVRFIQKTAEYELILHTEDKNPLEADASNPTELHPKNNRISFKNIK